MLLNRGYANFGEPPKGEVPRILYRRSSQNSCSTTFMHKARRRVEAANSPDPRHLSAGRNGSPQPTNLSALSVPQAVEDFQHRRRDVGVVVHHLPSCSFATVDVRRTPIDAYRLLSDLGLAMFGAQ